MLLEDKKFEIMTMTLGWTCGLRCHMQINVKETKETKSNNTPMPLVWASQGIGQGQV